MTDWTLVLGWGTPIGIGLFFVLMALAFFLLSKGISVNTKKKVKYPGREL